MVAVNEHSEAHLTDGDVKHYEQAIRRQMVVIKKDYVRLMDDVARGYGLVKHWVGNQAINTGEMIKSRFVKH